MRSVLGVSMGRGVIHLARPDQAAGGPPVAFDLQRVEVDGERAEVRTAEIIGAALADGVDATAVACRQDGRADALRSTLTERRLGNYQLVPEVLAALELFAATGELNGYECVAVYDLGSSGVSISVADTERKIVYGTERTTKISGSAFDAMIGESQVSSGRLSQPTGPAGFAAAHKLCRAAKEQLSTSTAVALPAAEGLVLLSRRDFETLITPMIEESARLLQRTVARARKPVEAVVLIGGGARIPLVADVLRRDTGLPVIVAGNPETVAARGAALLAHPVSRRRAWQESRETAGPRGAAEKIRRRRGLVSAGIAVGGLGLLVVLGLGLGTSAALFGSESNGGSTSTSTSTTTGPASGALSGPTGEQPDPAVPVAAPAVQGAAPPPVTTVAPIEAPAQTSVEQYEAPAPPPPPGPVTYSVPGLPPIVLPAIPPQYLPQLPRFP